MNMNQHSDNMKDLWGKVFYKCVIVFGVHVQYITYGAVAMHPPRSIYLPPLSSLFSGTQYKAPSPPFPVIPIGRHFGYLG